MAGSYTLWLGLGERNMIKLPKPSKAARIVKSLKGWYIIWYSNNIRYRLKNGINTVKDLNTRLFYANRIVNFINATLQTGKAVQDIDLPSSLFNFTETVTLPIEPTTQKFIDYVDVYIQRLENQRKSFYTVRKHITLRNSLKAYAQSLNKEDFSFSELDKHWANNYIAWRYDAPRCHHINYVSKDFDTIRHIIEEAESEDGIVVNPKYKSEAFKVKKIVSDEVSLDFAEVQKIYGLNLDEATPGMNIVRDDFVLACLTGMRWGNWKITPDNVVMVEGRKMIRIVTQKNYTTCLIPLHPIALAILEKYNFNVNTLSSQKTNDYIKILAEKAELTEIVVLKDSKAGKIVVDMNRKCEEMTTHTARRTFVTIALVEWQIPPQYVMQITGHKTERQLYEYARIDKNRAALEIAKVFDKI